MSSSKYTESSARKRILRNGGTFKGRQIAIKRAGLKILGAIDYLCKAHRYMWIPGSRDEDKKAQVQT